MPDITPDITPLFTVANQVLVNFFDKNDVDNYVSHVIEDKKKGVEYLITMQRINGDTPLHQLAKQNERVDVLEHALSQILELSNPDSNIRFDLEHFKKKLDLIVSVTEI
jgi:hypothetical protein